VTPLAIITPPPPPPSIPRIPDPQLVPEPYEAAGTATAKASDGRTVANAALGAGVETRRTKTRVTTHELSTLQADFRADNKCLQQPSNGDPNLVRLPSTAPLLCEGVLYM